jgi:UDP-glucose 4-epimerase
MRQPADIFPRGVEVVAVSDLTRSIDWWPLIKGVDVVVHLAGIAHATKGFPEEAYDRVNRIATEQLAAMARKANLRRLIFASSIRAQSGPAASHVLTESDPPRPTDPYGRSKLAAEDAIRASGVAHTILRPVLVYGPEAKGNLAALLRLARSPWPLPFASFTNRRSMIARQNLIGAIRFAIDAASTENQTFVAADPEAFTLAEIVATLRDSLGRPPALIPFPPRLIGAAMQAAGRSELWERLGGELVASPAKLMSAGWQPAVDTKSGLAEMAQAASPRKSGTASRSTR